MIIFNLYMLSILENHYFRICVIILWRYAFHVLLEIPKNQTTYWCKLDRRWFGQISRVMWENFEGYRRRTVSLTLLPSLVLNKTHFENQNNSNAQIHIALAQPNCTTDEISIIILKDTYLRLHWTHCTLSPDRRTLLSHVSRQVNKIFLVH